MERAKAWELLRAYNKDHFHLQHALTVEAVMRWFANDLGYGEEADYWDMVGLLHDIDFELYPEQHCVKCVELLQKAGVVTHLAFGSECGDLEALRRVEACLSGGAYQDAVRQRLEGGETFARCRQLAVEKLLGPQDAALLAQPNNILAIEYLKALRRADFPMEPVTFPRRGGQHDGPVMEGIAPASHIRRLLRTGQTEEAIALLPEESAAVLRRELAAVG